MINNVVLVGRLTAAPELKMTSGGKGVVNFTLAVPRTKEETDFINCSAWGNTAKFMADYLSKGSMLGCQGSIRVERYTNQENKKTTSWTVVCDSVWSLEVKK